MDVVRRDRDRSGTVRRHIGISIAAAVGLSICIPPAPASAAIGAIHWTKVSPATSPPARFGGVEAYDAARQVVVLFGGAGVTGQLLNDTWVWDGSNWQQRHPATSPPARIYHYMAYDSTHRYVLLFGGTTTTAASFGGTGTTATYFSDTWTWDGTTWAEQHPTTSPAQRASYGGISDDPLNGGVLLYGGYDTELSHFYYDTWIWDGSNWDQVSSAEQLELYLASLVFSPALGEVVALVQGTSSTWVFDGTKWIYYFPKTSPPGRYEYAMSAAGKGAVMFGGGSGTTFFSDTWYLTGRNWGQISGPGPAPRGYVSMALDAPHMEVVLFGGLHGSYSLYRDTWVLGP